MDEGFYLNYTAILCSECDSVIDVLSGKEEPLYIDKKCECGSFGFYTQILDVDLKIIVMKPYGRGPDFEFYGRKWYINEK